MAPRRTLDTLETERKTTIGFVNLGCSKNQVDSEVMLGSLVANGFELTSDHEKAEVVIINTGRVVFRGATDAVRLDDAMVAQHLGVF